MYILTNEVNNQKNSETELKSILKNLNISENEVLIAAETDLDLEGDSISCWVISTPQNIYAFKRFPTLTIDGPFPYEKIKKIRLRQTIGSAFLEIQLDGLTIELVRFSNKHRERFSRVVFQLKRIRDGKGIDEESLLAPDDRICPKCGLVLPARNAPCPKCLQQGDILKRTLILLHPYLKWIVLILILLIMGIALDMLPPYLTKTLVDNVLAPKKHFNWLFWLVAAIGGASLIKALLNIAIGSISTHIGTQVTADVRERIFKKLQELSIDYYDRTSVGGLMTRIYHDVEVFHGFVNQVAHGFLINVLMIIAIGIMLFYLNSKLAIYVLFPIPFVVAGTWFFWHKIYPKYFKLWDSQSKFSMMIYGILSGIRTVKAFAQEKREAQRFEKYAIYLRDSRRRVDKSISVFNPIMGFVFGLGGLIIWFAGGKNVFEGEITLGTLMAFLGYLGLFYSPLSNLTMFSNWVTSFLTASQRIFEIFDTEPSIIKKANPISPAKLKGDIVFENVWFGYDRYHPVLKDISLKIEAGQTVGIVGKSGSGKTTLMNVLCRFYDCQQGKITIDGIDIKDIDLFKLRENIGLVLQEPFLFRASIAENIAYGRPKSTMKEIIWAAKIANCHEFIMKLPAGYDTRLGEKGAGISTGEKQRISIARAVLCNPSILILDEATSSVDTEAEQQIQEALKIIYEGRTSIAIAHRLSTLKDADCIFVIDSGRLVESGNHKELMEKKGIYYKLVKIQTQLATIDE